MRNRIFLLYLCLVFPCCAFSQDVKQELQKVMDWFVRYPNLEIRSTFQSFGQENTTLPSETLHCVFFKKADTLQYTQIGYLEFIRGANFGLNVNNRTQSMTLQTSSPQAGFGNLPSQLDFSGLLAHCKTSSCQKLESGLSQCVLELKSGEYEKIILEYETATHRPKKYETVMREDASGAFATAAKKLVVTYSTINTKPTYPPNAFSESPYVRMQLGQWKCQDKYKKYTLSVN